MKIFKFSAIFIIFLVIISIVIWNYSTRSSAQVSEPGCSPVINKDVASIPAGVDIFPGDTVDITIAIPGCTDELRNPADTMLVMDRSGSMRINWLGKLKIDSAKDALKAFVDQTQEDGATPGDYVGLATYSSNASLDFGIANMTAANKTAIKTAIDSFSADGVTSIGDGINVANQELLNNGRGPEVAKYMVLATDGRQNRAPSPYENDILQTAIDNNITIFTVGIGSDVTVPSTNWAGCVDCPDPNGDGSFSGEEIMKDIACKTDQNRLDLADNCILVWDTTNDPSINDLDNPAHYYFADDPAKLAQIYEDIANEINSNVWYQVLDVINATVFQNIVTGSVHAVDCATGNPWPGVTVLLESGNFFMIRLENVEENDTVCIKLQAVVKPNVAGDFAVDQIGLAVVWDPDNLCDPAVDGIITCIIQMFPLPRINIPRGNITIVNPAKPWLKTTGGDVGSFFNIDMIRDVNLDGLFNADYLVIAQNPYVIDNFYSDKGWEIDQYGGLTGLILDPDPTNTTMYDALWDKYESKIEDTTGTVVPPPDQLNNGIITGAVSVDGGVMLWQGNIGGVNVTNFGAGANERSTVIFVDGSMTIDKNISIDANSGIIFIVREDIIVENDVTEIDGIFITNGLFNSRNGTNCGDLNPNKNDVQLVINGAVHAFGELCFTRDLGASNENTPAELINYEPKYLYFFQEIVGDPTVIYREVAP